MISLLLYGKRSIPLILCEERYALGLRCGRSILHSTADANYADVKLITCNRRMKFANGLPRMEVAMEELLDGEAMIMKIVLPCLHTLNLAWKPYWNRVKGAKSCVWPWRRCLSLIAI